MSKATRKAIIGSLLSGALLGMYASNCWYQNSLSKPLFSKASPEYSIKEHKRTKPQKKKFRRKRK